MITVLMGFAGLAVDLGNWYLHIQRAQRAADAAALDGDVYMPARFADAAVPAAKAALVNNGVPAADAAKATISRVAGKPNDLRVSVQTTVGNTFLKLLKLKSQQVFTRTAQATHLPALHIGTGTNMAGGFLPGGSGAAWNWAKLGAIDGNYWVGIQGQDTPKVNGDRYQTKACGSVPNTYQCSGTNAEYDSTGYDFHIRIAERPGGGTAYLMLEAYDPGYAQTKGECTNATYNAGVPHAGEVPWCSGDENYNHPDTFAAPNAKYTLIRSEKDTTPVATCKTFPGSQNASKSMGKAGFEWIHAWVPVCTAVKVDLSGPTDYVLRVKSGAGDGVNNFMLQAALMGSSGEVATNAVNPSISASTRSLSQQLVTIAADTSFAVDNRLDNINVRFPLAQIPAEYAGQTVQLEFYDVGDADRSGTMTVASEVGSMTAGGGSCKYSISTGIKSYGPVQSSPGCKVPMTASDDGKNIKFQWTVPTSYNCTPTDASRNGGCWTYVQMFYPPGSVPDDFTTWTMDMPGYPVRLTKIAP